MADRSERPRWRRRLGKAARFVALVWGLALLFKTLEAAGGWLLGTAIETGAVDVEMVTPSAPEIDACATEVAALSPAPRDLEHLTRVRVQAFRLGASLGREAAIRNVRDAGADTLAEMARDRERLAAELGVPAPAVPAVRKRARMFYEFSSYLVADPECVSAALARVYTPQHASLYRLGAVAAQTVYHRERNLGAEAAYRADVRRYAAAAGVPEPLWAPLARGAPRDPRDLDRARREAETAFEAIETWAAGTPP